MRRLHGIVAALALGSMSCGMRPIIETMTAKEPPPPRHVSLYRDTFQPLILESHSRIAADAGCPINTLRTSDRTWTLRACALRLECWAHDDLSWDCAQRASDQL